MDLDLQAKLLRALQEGELQRVGGSETITFDARVISATNQNLRAMVHQGRFRKALYDRLVQYPIELPPLRERGEDALRLADHFRERHIWNYPAAERRRFSTAARAFILAYPWPGNVRELKDAVERALATAEKHEIMPADLRPEKPAPRVPDAAPPEPTGPGSDGQTPAEVARSAASPREILPLEDLKLLAVEHAYHLCGGNINKTSLKLGITRATVYRLLRKRGVEI
jgi:DNA-binding NtrC family response regulator